MDKKQVENYIFYALLIFPVVLFILIPAHPAGDFDFALNRFVDKYLLGNGYYMPSNYPFSAKVVNSFTVGFAVIMGTFVGIWRKDDVIRVPKHIWCYCLLIFGLGISTFLLSLYPQVFKVSTGRSFGTSEAFHNNPVLFLFMIIAKEICIYIGIRAPLTFLLFAIDYSRK